MSEENNNNSEKNLYINSENMKENESSENLNIADDLKYVQNIENKDSFEDSNKIEDKEKTIEPESEEKTIEFEDKEKNIKSEGKEKVMISEDKEGITDSEKTKKNRYKSGMSEQTRNIVEWIVCIVIAVVLTLLFRYYIATPTVVKQVSMYPTLQSDQRLIVKRTFRITKSTPKRGDIVTFEAPTHIYSEGTVDQSNPVAIYTEENRNAISNFAYNILEVTKTSYIKRVIALPGEHVEITDGKVYINGEEFEEEYLSDDVSTISKVFTDFIVPEGYYFCMGDNRMKSTDCREFGCIPYEKIEGIVICRFWPLNVIGSVK